MSRDKVYLAKLARAKVRRRDRRRLRDMQARRTHLLRKINWLNELIETGEEFIELLRQPRLPHV